MESHEGNPKKDGKKLLYALNCQHVNEHFMGSTNYVPYKGSHRPIELWVPCESHVRMIAWTGKWSMKININSKNLKVSVR